MLANLARTDTDDIELKPSFQQLALDLLRDTVEANVAARKDSIGHCRSHPGRRRSILTRRLRIYDRGMTVSQRVQVVVLLLASRGPLEVINFQVHPLSVCYRTCLHWG